MRDIQRIGRLVTVDPSILPWDRIPLPAGAVNAIARGQTEEKYRSDYNPGKIGELAVLLWLRSLGYGTSDLDLSVEPNAHAPDLYLYRSEQTHPVDVKTQSVLTPSWVFQFTSWVSLEKPGIAIFTGNIDSEKYRAGTPIDVEIKYVLHRRKVLELWKNMALPHLITKRAVYEKDLVELV